MNVHISKSFEMTTQPPAQYSVGISVLIIGILSIAGWVAVIGAAYLIF
jgi:hypothetical protein